MSPDEPMEGLDRGESRVITHRNDHGYVSNKTVQVNIGTSVIEVSDRIRNPITERSHQLHNLSDNGYLKHFLALLSHASRPDVIDMGSAPILSFDKDRWEVREKDDHIVLVKRQAETELDKRVLENSSE